MQKYKLILKKSLIGCTQQQKSTVKGLGLRRIGQQSIVPVNAVTKGQINKVQHLLSWQLVGAEKTKDIVKS